MDYSRGLSIRGVLLCLVAGLSLFVPSAVRAQVVAFSGGASSLLHTSGMETDYTWGEYSGFLGLGYADGFQVGGVVGTRYRGFDLKAGDTEQTFVVDTDLFDSGSPGFNGRGLQVSRNGENTSWRAFAGASSLQRYLGFYQTYEADTPTGVFAYKWKMSDRWTFHSTTIAQDKFTNLDSVRYQIRKDWVVAAGAGVGRNSPFASLVTSIDTDKYKLSAGYAVLGDGFQRFKVVNGSVPEHSGFNVRAVYRPTRHWALNANHENLTSVLDTSQTVRQLVRLDGVGANGVFHKFQLGAGLTHSTSGDLWTNTKTASVSRQVFNNFLSMSAMLTQLDNQYGRNRFTTISGQERISPRLSVRETFTHGANQNSLSAGGTFRSNRLTLGVEQQLIYDTLATGGRSFYKAWTVNLHMGLFRSFRLNTDSYIDQSGRMRYTGFVDGILMARSGDAVHLNSGQTINPEFGKFVVKGLVQDESGKPVWGICVHVDGQTAFSDNTGQFYIRFSRGETYPVQVHMEQSLAPQTYEVVSAPVSVRAETSDMAPTIVIVVRLSKTPPPPPTHRRRSALEGPESEIEPGGGN